MKATDLLEQQHDEVKALFGRIERDGEDAEEIFQKLARSLVAHDAIEREIFYPACERTMGMNETLGEALVEHGVVEFSLYQAEQARGGDDFAYKCTVLKEVLEHHIEEEEDTLFVKVEETMDDDRLEELGARMKDRFEEVVAKDFRGPLYQNLRRVLGGAMEASVSRTKGSTSPVKKGNGKKAKADKDTKATRIKNPRQGGSAHASAKAKNGKDRSTRTQKRSRASSRKNGLSRHP